MSQLQNHTAHQGHLICFHNFVSYQLLHHSNTLLKYTENYLNLYKNSPISLENLLICEVFAQPREEDLLVTLVQNYVRLLVLSLVLVEEESNSTDHTVQKILNLELSR